MRLRIAYTDHLVDLLVRAEAAATRLASADPGLRASMSAAARRQSARLSARLDGSPLTNETADAVDAGAQLAVWHRQRAAPAQGSWARVLRLEGMPTEDVAALEYANLLACFDAEPEIAREFFDRPLAALRRLHGLICAGLVAPDVVGRPRVTAQAVHDGAQGRVIYRAPEPEMVPELLDGLVSWLGRRSATMPTVVVAGIVQERLLEWQPFEAANGRLARVVSRVVLRARGFDPDGAAVYERPLAADPLGYYGEVAATVRRGGDLVPWLERYTEAALAALEQAVDAVAPRAHAEPSARALGIASALEPGETLTLTEYAARVETSLETARADLRALARVGLFAPEPRTHGLRFRRR